MRDNILASHGMSFIKNIFLYLVPSLLILSHAYAEQSESKSTLARDDERILISEVKLPESDLLSAEARKILSRIREEGKKITCQGKLFGANEEEILAFRKCHDDLIAPTMVAKHRAIYKVSIEPKLIRGIYTELISPSDGVSPENSNRILINLHGGGFVVGARVLGQVESIPIAATGKIRVLSIDYRQGPEHKFPSASEDVAIIYKELLKQYAPQNIGIYGCSAGGRLTAQAVAWFQKERLPAPGAVGMFCAAAMQYLMGDMWYVNTALLGLDISASSADSPRLHYVAAESLDDPLFSPARSPRILERFPPSLLISSTRDPSLSDVVYTHSQLVKLGVTAHLHIWEGLGHGFFYLPELPESREVYDVVVKFFEQYLGSDKRSHGSNSAVKADKS